MTAKKITKAKKPSTPKDVTKKRGRPKKAKKITYVALVIDRSGSMGSVENAAFSGINEQIQTIKDNAAKGGDTFVTYIQFDSVIDLMFDKKPAKELQEITRDQYSPRGSTSMYDAVFTAIKRLQDGVTETADTGYLVVVISDGEENSSREITGQGLADEIKKLQDTGKWTFAYMLSNQDLSKVTQKLNLNIGNMASYAATKIVTTQAFTRSATATSAYLTLRENGTTATMDFYNNSEPTKDEKGK